MAGEDVFSGADVTRHTAVVDPFTEVGDDAAVPASLAFGPLIHHTRLIALPRLRRLTGQHPFQVDEVGP